MRQEFRQGSAGWFCSTWPWLGPLHGGAQVWWRRGLALPALPENLQIFSLCGCEPFWVDKKFFAAKHTHSLMNVQLVLYTWI
jgi:hypothetical protein